MAVASGVLMLAACSESTARFDEPTSFRFSDRDVGSRPSGYWNGADPAPDSSSGDYAYRGGRDPVTGAAPSHLPPSSGRAYGDGQASAGNARRQGGGQRHDAAQAEGYGTGRQAYADGRDDYDRRSGGYQASGGYDNSPSPPSSVGMTSLPPPQAGSAGQPPSPSGR